MKFISRFICLMSLASFAQGQAQIQVQDNIPTEDNPWYEVSIVIFKQPKHLLQSEQWKTGDELSLTLPRHLIALEEPPEETTEAPEQPAQTDTATDANGTALEGTPTEAIELPTAFLVKEATDEEFIKTVERLNRSPNFDIIYQKSWMQPGLDKKHALPVLIQANAVGDGLYELEGTTSLHVARYLHLESHLWLSEYVQQLEVIKPWWQEDSAADDAAKKSLSDEPLTNTEFNFPLQQDNGLNAPLSLEQPLGMESSMAMGDTITRYKSIQTGVLKESRRMRSGELHYIDHPLFGMVVKVTPYELPEPEDTDEDASIAAQTDL